MKFDARPTIPHPLTILAGGFGIPGDPFGLIGGILFPPQDETDWVNSFAMAAPWHLVCSMAANPVYSGGPYMRLSNATEAAAEGQCGLTNQAMTPNWDIGDPEDAAVQQMLRVADWRCVIAPCDPDLGTNSRYHFRMIWHRHNVGTGAPKVSYRRSRPARGPLPIHPTPSPAIDPMSDPWAPPTQDPSPAPQPHVGPVFDPQPFGEPAPGTDAPPYEAPAPGVVVLPQPGTWPSPGSPPVSPVPGVPVPVPVPTPLPVPAPGTPPYVVPGTSLDVTPRPGPSPRPQPRVGHVRMPPRRGTKEKKLTQNAVTEVFKGLINFVTESADGVNALFYAISKADRVEGGAVGFMSPLDKASFVWSNFHRVNWREFMKNFFKNQAEDWIYGQLGRGSAWMQQQGGISLGFKDAALSGRATANKGGDQFADGRNPAVDAVNEFIDAVVGTDPGFNTPWRRVAGSSAKPVVKNWRRINKWKKKG